MIFLFVFEYIKLIFVNFKKKKYKLFLILIIIPLFLFLYIRNYFKHPKCKGWEKGLLNTKLESKEDSLKANKCYIISPEECHIDAFEIINDYSKYVKKNCINKNNYKKNVEKFFTFDTKTKYKYIAYPSTKSLNYHEDGEESFFHKKILSMITPVNSTEDDPNLETFVEYDKNNRGKVIINLKKNNTLIEEREKLAKNFSVKYENIFFLYTDAVSRPHFRRKMKNTIKLLEDYYYNNPNKKENWNAYQFFKYNSFTSSTPHNVMPMFFGKSTLQREGTSIIKYLKELGYITVLAQNQCVRYLFDSNSYYYGFDYETFDHEFISLFCDPNYSYPDLKNPIFNGPFSLMRKCLYGTDTFNHVFEYGRQFLETYKNQRKFLKLAFIDGHDIVKEIFVPKKIVNIVIK